MQNKDFFLKVAAMLLIALTTGLFIYQGLRPAKGPPVVYTTISTKAGSGKHVQKSA